MQHDLNPALRDENLNARQQKCQHAARVCLQSFMVATVLVTFGFSMLVYYTGECVFSAWQWLKPWFGFWRLLVFMVLMGRWPYWIKRFSDWAGLHPVEYQCLLNARRRIGVFLLVIDGILVQDWLDGMMAVNL